MREKSKTVIIRFHNQEKPQKIHTKSIAGEILERPDGRIELDLTLFIPIQDENAPFGKSDAHRIQLIAKEKPDDRRPPHRRPLRPRIVLLDHDPQYELPWLRLMAIAREYPCLCGYIWAIMETVYEWKRFSSDDESEPYEIRAVRRELYDVLSVARQNRARLRIAPDPLPILRHRYGIPRDQSAFEEKRRKAAAHIAAAFHVLRKNKKDRPRMQADPGGRLYPIEGIEHAECCDHIRAPSRNFPLSLLNHCKTAAHLARVFEVEEKEVRRIARSMSIQKAQQVIRSAMQLIQPR